MINTPDFIKRLQKVIDYYGESASSFAEKIGVQRSSISHILSGRNKPSLDFVLKILHTYPEVELYWLLNGKGNFPHQSNSATQSPETKPQTPNKNIVPETIQTEAGKTIKRIIIFYDDGSFENFEKSLKAICAETEFFVNFLWESKILENSA